VENRNRYASEVLTAWKEFDRTLENDDSISSSNVPLSAFRLNDAIYSRAAWSSITQRQYPLHRNYQKRRMNLMVSNKEYHWPLLEFLYPFTVIFRCMA